MRILFLFVVAIALWSCDPRIKRFEKPEDVVPKDTMVLVLKDIMLVESFINHRHNSAQEFHVAMKKSGQGILTSYGLDSVRFDKSMDYYASHQSVMKSIYNQVLDSVNHEVSVIQSKKE